MCEDPTANIIVVAGRTSLLESHETTCILDGCPKHSCCQDPHDLQLQMKTPCMSQRRGRRRIGRPTQEMRHIIAAVTYIATWPVGSPGPKSPVQNRRTLPTQPRTSSTIGKDAQKSNGRETASMGASRPVDIPPSLGHGHNGARGLRLQLAQASSPSCRPDTARHRGGEDLIQHSIVSRRCSRR